MKLPYRLYLSGILLFSVLISCSEKQSTQAPPPMKVKVVEVFTKDVPIERDFVSSIYGQYDIPIRARVEGFLEGIHFEEGSRVKKGDLLYTIDPQPFEAAVAEKKSNLAEAQIAAVKAENDLNRIRPLAEIKAVSEIDLDAAVA